MTRIYVPTKGAACWQALLAKPELHFAPGFSAQSLANSWEAAGGLPPEISALLKPLIGDPELLLALPEHKTPLPGGRRESQSDVFALVRGSDHVVACTIEGKVDEPFGPTVGEWLVDASEGKERRLAFICQLLGLAEAPHHVRYQLLHRTAAAAVESERFMTGAAAMIVHSFSPDARWFGDFEGFLKLFGATAAEGEGALVEMPNGRPLYLGWAAGDQRYRSL